MALSRMALLEHSLALANQALELSPTPLVNATVLILQGNIPAAINLVKEDKFEQGFLYLACYLWAKEKDDLVSAQELLGSALRLD